MFVPTFLLLVLSSCVSAATVSSSHGAPTARDEEARGNGYIYRGIANGEGVQVADSLMVNDNRRKRTIMTVNAAFLRAWKSILRTAIGSLFGLNEKAFIKIGTMDDAMKDFISFKPDEIIEDSRHGSLLRGFVGNQVIKIGRDAANEPVITIYRRSRRAGVPDPRQTQRSIYYFKNQNEAKKYLRVWKNYMLRQYTEQKY